MANFDTIKTAIDANINTNGNQAITGAVMNSVLKQMVDSTDAEIAELESELDTNIANQKNEIADFKETITDQVENYKPIVINGNVTNAADEEDITSEGNLLKLKDRSALNGMGYVILRKNKTFASQVSKPNTIYEIRYDFDLSQATHIIPSDCALSFNGGSIQNGEIVGNDTSISNHSNGMCFQDVSIRGTWKANEVHSSWFSNNDTEFLKSAFYLAANSTLYLHGGVYELTQEILLENTSIRIQGTGNPVISRTGSSSRIKVVNTVGEQYVTKISGVTFEGNSERFGTLYILGSDIVSLEYLTIRNMGSHEDTSSYIADGVYIQHCQHLRIFSCNISNCKRDGIYCGCAESMEVSASYIRNCGRYGIVNDGSQGDRNISATRYVGNTIEGCDGGVHAENKMNAAYEGHLIVKDNRIKSCCKTGSSFAAITSGNRLHATISGNIIEDNISNTQRSITFSNPLSVNVYDNRLIRVGKGIIYSGDSVVPSGIIISNNIFVDVTGIAIDIYNGATNNSVVSNNTISLLSGEAIHCILCSRIRITDNLIRSMVNSGSSEIKGIVLITTPVAYLQNNICTGIFAMGLEAYTDKVGGVVAYSYIRNYVVRNNVFPSNRFFNTSFEVENGIIELRNSNAGYLPAEVEGFSYASKDICHAGNIDYIYTGAKWSVSCNVPYGEFSKAPIDAAKGTMYYCTDKQTRGGRNGVLMIATGNYSFITPDGAFYSSVIDTLYAGTTSQRPTSAGAGFEYFDTDLGKPIWCKSSGVWVDATGATV